MSGMRCWRVLGVKIDRVGLFGGGQLLVGGRVWLVVVVVGWVVVVNG